jgi:hypothetical protein
MLGEKRSDSARNGPVTAVKRLRILVVDNDALTP